MAKPKFDLSLLAPVDEGNPDFESNLQPVEENSAEDAGAYLDNLPPPEGSHPLRSAAIGLTHAGRNLHNLPHDIVSGLEGLNEWYMGKDSYWKNHRNEKGSFKLSEHLPYDKEDYSDVFGGNKNEKTLVDKIVQGGFEYGPELIGLGGVGRAALRKFPITKGAATRQLNKAEKLAAQEGVPNIPLSQKMIDEAVNYLPNTHASRELLEAAQAGKYSPSFSLQSQLGKHQRDLAKSPLAAERLLSPKVGELKQNIISKMDMGLRAHGYGEIADLMKGGLNDYRKYMKFKQKVLPVMAKIGIPTSALALLGFGVPKVKQLTKNLID